jgi:PilZ domain
VTDERRHADRYRPSSGVMARIRTIVQAEICNISASGALIRTSQALVPGTKCELRLVAPGNELKVSVLVTRCKLLLGETRTYEAGLEFQESDLDAESKSALEKILEKAKKGRPLSGVLKGVPSS